MMMKNDKVGCVGKGIELAVVFEFDVIRRGSGVFDRRPDESFARGFASL